MACKVKLGHLRRWPKVRSGQVRRGQVRRSTGMILMKMESNVTYSTLNFIVSRTTDLIGDIVERLQTKTMALLSTLGHADSPEVGNLKKEFPSCATPFKGLETDYKQIEYFSNSGRFIQPLEEKLPGLSYVQQRDRDSGSVRQVAVADTFQRIPLTPLLNRLLSLPGVLKAMLSWQQREGHCLGLWEVSMDSREQAESTSTKITTTVKTNGRTNTPDAGQGFEKPDSPPKARRVFVLLFEPAPHRLRTTGLEDFFDGEFCKSHPLFLKEISLPILLYNDDCETVNPLGSKTGIHKLGFLYFSIKSLPPQLLSSLKSQFLLAVYKADDIKTYGLDAILRPIVEEIKCLETNGIRITSPDFQGVVKCTIAQVVGDNLGLNAILGYIESFSGHHVCRWCSVERTVLRTMTSEDSVLMRSRASHQDDLTIGNPTLTGLKRDSFLNNLNFYHVTDNVAPDVMHDILEGIGPYEVKLILNSLIENNHLTLDKLNYRITSFDYGFADKRNKPSVISKHDLRNIDGAMRQSAAQSWCLLRLLPLMVGDLVPHGCKEWHLLLLLLSCMELLFSPSLTQPAVQYLGKIIEEHHTLFLELFPHRHLRPKHHFMIHYPSAIQKPGPLVQYWAMRFEAKHGFFKRISHVTCNFRNICKTMAFRHQMMQCYTILSGTILKNNFEVGPGHSTFLSYIDGIQKVQCTLGLPLFTEVFVPTWVIFNGSEYRPGMTVFLSCNAEGEPQFGRIHTILVLQLNVIQPTADTKMALAASLVEAFPLLKDASETGFVSTSGTSDSLIGLLIMGTELL
ncbi:hypothetical protein N1851_022924 [Merluccius polli]|uniref:Uncharacterized protein n=1 Tax=Merluccius polli TaxID=89951 RepID=A0AA47MHC2_MERPO|nr:hypothetical protein N1851_022924 [Merluccius polli]